LSDPRPSLLGTRGSGEAEADRDPGAPHAAWSAARQARGRMPGGSPDQGFGGRPQEGPKPRGATGGGGTRHVADREGLPQGVKTRKPRPRTPDPSRTGTCVRRRNGTRVHPAETPGYLCGRRKLRRVEESQERCRRETEPTRIVRGSNRREGGQTLWAERTGEGFPETSDPPIRQVLKGKKARERGR